MSCGVGHTCGLDPVLLWLWPRLAAVALIRALAWQPPYAGGAALKSQKKRSVAFWKILPLLTKSCLKTQAKCAPLIVIVTHPLNR